jgi:hypothetical protein
MARVKLPNPPTREHVLECFRYALTEITLADIEREIDICKVIAGHWFTGEADDVNQPAPDAAGEEG